MLFGSPLRAATSRNGSASPEDRKADSNCDECTTDLTRYGSRPCSLPLMTDLSVVGLQASETRVSLLLKRFAERNVKRLLRRSAQRGIGTSPRRPFSRIAFY